MGDVCAQRRVVRIQQRRGRGDYDVFAHAGRSQSEIERSLLIHGQHHARSLRRPKTLQVSLHRVPGWPQTREEVFALVVGANHVGNICSRVGDGPPPPVAHCTRSIRDGASQLRAITALSDCETRKTCHYACHQNARTKSPCWPHENPPCFAWTWYFG